MECNFKSLSVKQLDKHLPSIDQLANDSFDSQKKEYSDQRRDIQFSDFSKDLDIMQIDDPKHQG